MLAPFVTATLLAVAPLETVRVRVEDADHRPVAGAWVACCDQLSSELDVDQIRAWLDQGARGRPQSSLHWVMTDAEGSALVAETGFWNDVVALTPSGGGHVIAARGTVKQVVIALGPHRYWRVRVVNPADPEVRPRTRVSFARELGVSRRRSQSLATVETDVEGVATFGPVDLAVDPEQSDAVLMATLDMPCLVAPNVRTTVRQLPADASTLALPPHGALEIQVVEEGGRGCERPVVVEVSSNEFTQLDLSGPYQGTWQKDLVNEHSTIRLYPVGLGLEMRVFIDEAPRGRSKGIRTKAIDGTGVVPALEAQGEVRVVRLEAPADARQRATVPVRGRALDAEGRPLRDHRLDFVVADASEEEATLEWPTGRSGEDGSFTADLPIDPTLAGRGTLRFFDRGPTDAKTAEDVATAACAVAELSGWRGGAVGDLRFDPLPLLLAGRVVGPDGAPEPDAQIELACDLEQFEADPKIPSWWRKRFKFRFHACDAEGRFEIHGFAGDQTWTATRHQVATADGARSPRLLPVGARDVELRPLYEDRKVEKKDRGAIAGSLLLDAGVPDDVIDVLLVPPDWNQEEEERADRSGDAGKRPARHSCCLYPPFFFEVPGDRFGSEEVDAGTWSLRVVFGTLGQPRRELVRRDDVVIEVGKTLLVPPIDLRGKIQVVQVELVDAKGRPVPAGHVFCREQSERPRGPQDRSLEELPDYGRFDAGRYVACALDDWPTLEFLGHDCRRVSKKFEHAGTFRLVLPPPIEVRFKLPDGLRLPPTPLTLDVALRTEQILTGVMFIHGGEPPNGDSATFVEGEEVALHLPAAATYRLSLNVSHSKSSGSSSWWRGYDLFEGVSLNIVERDEPRTYVLPVKQEAIDKAVKELGF